mgnify:CR=1 FL=1
MQISYIRFSQRSQPINAQCRESPLTSGPSGNVYRKTKLIIDHGAGSIPDRDPTS